MLARRQERVERGLLQRGEMPEVGILQGVDDLMRVEILGQAWIAVEDDEHLVAEGIGPEAVVGPVQPEHLAENAEFESCHPVTDEGDYQIKLRNMRRFLEEGDKIKVTNGAFQNFEGEVEEIIPDKGMVRIITTIFGRPTPLELEYWQIEKM